MIPESLKKVFEGHRRVAVALSGGVDSAVLLALAIRTLGRDSVLAITATGPIFPPEESELARRTAGHLGVEHYEVKFEPLSLPAFRENPPDRCYHCKKALFEKFYEVARAWGAEAVWDGTQLDDLFEDRPGLRALKELGVESPLLAGGLNKTEVRKLARKLGLPQAEKTSSPCLATRFPPGEPVTEEALKMVYEAERKLKDLLKVQPLRVRYLRGEARVEVPEGALERAFYNREIWVKSLKLLGFKKVSLDLEGYGRKS
ncbi:ATP-dependent sacrificial sulfur transferase LarE [Thermosulfurimonas dismutans]|uniref:ATP-utilizing enzyme of the PP-loop superfamily n=1 Tax=Thermosulfurimonas dismutans TaxID=999894 RepID=A0A179D4N6_9BACT|nr:ATP-dependent sacrificial sulfur transferase LarE [Thermosulfurimonas dismutans]OAQ20432.1 ATP-utilizing enzyme of the PP-loop superfamily [Thermosulfurimonas dismutans]